MKNDIQKISYNCWYISFHRLQLAETNSAETQRPETNSAEIQRPETQRPETQRAETQRQALQKKKIAEMTAEELKNEVFLLRKENYSLRRQCSLYKSEIDGWRGRALRAEEDKADLKRDSSTNSSILQEMLKIWKTDKGIWAFVYDLININLSSLKGKLH